MNRIIYSILTVVMLISLAACSDDTTVDMPVGASAGIPAGYADTHISIEDALGNAAIAMEAISDGTRNTGREVESVTILSRGKTRSDGEGLLYMVNYADNAGFALLGSDSRMEPVYAISEAGHMELADTVSDPAFAQFISDALNHSAQSLSATGPVFGGSFELKRYNVYTNKKIINPILPDFISNLHCNSAIQDQYYFPVSNFTIANFKVWYITANGTKHFDNYELEIAINRGNSPKYTDNQKVSYAGAALLSIQDFFNSGGTFMDFIELNHFLIFENCGYEYDTGCACSDYWGIRLNVHLPQLEKLLTFTGYGFLDMLRAQPVIITPSGESTGNEFALVVDGLMTRNRYTYTSHNDKLVEGPVKEYWLHCSWSNASANGYYLYTQSQDAIEDVDSMTRLYMFGGISNNLDSGI